MAKPDRYLLKRADSWHYNRRTPKRYAHIENRTVIRASLRTKSIDVARMRRDAFEAADDAYWQALSIEAAATGGVSIAATQVAEKRHKAASERALALGFAYTPADILASHTSTNEILERLKVLEGRAGKSEVAPEKDADALLGTVQKPKRLKKRVSQAFALFIKEIAFDELRNKSDKQRYSWEKTKRTSVEYFIEFAGDQYMEEISRDAHCH